MRECGWDFDVGSILMKFALLLGISTVLCWGQRSSIAAGYFPENTEDNYGAMFVYQVDDSVQLVDFVFVPDAARTTTSITFNILSLSGTPAAGSARIDIKADLNGDPSGPSLASGTMTPTTGWKTISVGLAVNPNTRYHAVLTNTNTDPTTNYFIVKTGVIVIGDFTSFNLSQGDIFRHWGWLIKATHNGGTTWDAGVAWSGFQVSYADGHVDGLPWVPASTATSTNGVAYGVSFTSLPVVSMRIKGVGFKVTDVGEPLGNLRYRIYVGTTLQGEVLFPGSTFPKPSGGYLWAVAQFPSPVLIPPGSDVRVTYDSDNASDTADGWLSRVYTVSPTGAPTTPFSGTSYISKTGSTWSSPDATQFLPFILIMDAQAFAKGSTQIRGATLRGGSIR